MSVAVGRPKSRMTVDEYLVWAEGRPGRYELYGGEVFAMAPERAAHAEIKGAVYEVLKAATRAARCGCHVLPDGMTVRVDPDAAHEPDALVYCGQKVAGDAIEIPEPVIVVEVLSPSTRRIDASAKLADYFRVQSIAHYLIVEPDPSKHLVIHHARNGDAILTRIVTGTVVRLDPPGIEIDTHQFYA